MMYRCYAKVNLTLEILGKRGDGYHDLASLVHTISLADDLRIETANEVLTRVEGLDIEPDTNLVARAAALLEAWAKPRRGAELSLVKRIPAAAGLGGGSSDAAATLVGLNTLWGSRLNLGDLASLAGQLGADVPFFLRGGAALMRGRGDLLEPLPPVVDQWLVLVVPPHDVIAKTRRLYAALEAGDFSSGDATLRAADRVRRGQPLEEGELSNGFARAARAVFGGLDDMWNAAERATRRRFNLSGAGPAIFALAEDGRDARLQARALSELMNVATFAVRTVKHARAATRIGYA